MCWPNVNRSICFLVWYMCEWIKLTYLFSFNFAFGHVVWILNTFEYFGRNPKISRYHQYALIYAWIWHCNLCPSPLRQIFTIKLCVINTTSLKKSMEGTNTQQLDDKLFDILINEHYQYDKQIKCATFCSTCGAFWPNYKPYIVITQTFQ